MLSSVARLYEYTPKGIHLGKYSLIKSNFTLLDDLVKSYLAKNPSEASLRKHVPIIHSIISLWSHEKSESIVLLWEFFYKKINSSFYIPGAKLDAIATKR